MANGYNPDLGLTSLSDLLGIINYVGGGNKQENYGSLFKLHSEHVQSYDNEEIDYSLQKSQEYLDKYRDKMSDVEIEQYDLLIDKYGHQKERNNNYASSYDLFATSYNDQLLELGEDYADAETATSWDYIESTTDPNGQTIQTQHKVNFPDWQALGYTGPNDKEFLNSAEYISFMNEVGGVDGYIAARNDYKVHVKNKLEDQIKSFIQTKEAFRSKYADRLSSDFADHNQNLEEMNFAYSFLLSSIEDGVLDSEERNAYEQSLMRSDIRPITDFEAKTGEVRKISREWTLKNMVTNVGNADTFYDHFQKFDSILEVDMGQVNPNDPYLTIPAEFLKDEKDPQIVSYQEAHDWASTQNPTEAMLLDPRYNYLANVGGLLQQTKAQIEQQDSNLIKNSGASFINTLHGRDWLDDVRAGDAAFVPGQPGTLVDDDDDDVIDTDLPVVDISQDAQNISVRNQNGITTGNKININYTSPSQVQQKKDGVTLVPYPGARYTFIKNDHLSEYHNPTIVDKDSLIQAVFDETNKPVVGHDGPGKTLDAFLLTYNPRIRKKITKLLRKFWKLNDSKKTKEANAIGQEILSFINQTDKNKKMEYPVIGYTAGMIGQ